MVLISGLSANVSGILAPALRVTSISTFTTSSAVKLRSDSLTFYREFLSEARPVRSTRQISLIQLVVINVVVKQSKDKERSWVASLFTTSRTRLLVVGVT